MGCTMMKKVRVLRPGNVRKCRVDEFPPLQCHLNTCPVGIATQDPSLRAKFTGQPEHVINFFYYVAEELRSIMAKLGFRTINEMVGRADLLKVDEALRNPKTASLDLSALLKPAWEMRPGVATYKAVAQEHKLHLRLDNKCVLPLLLSLPLSSPRSDFSSCTGSSWRASSPSPRACPSASTARSSTPSASTSLLLPSLAASSLSLTPCPPCSRALGTTLSNHVSKRYGEDGLPKDTIHIVAKGSAGQSLGAFLAPGITFRLEGEANDYVGKGLSGGRIIVYPHESSTFKAEENIIVSSFSRFLLSRRLPPSPLLSFPPAVAPLPCSSACGALVVLEAGADSRSHPPPPAPRRSATRACTARRAARPTSAAFRPSASPCATRAPSPSSRAAATTAAST